MACNVVDAKDYIVKDEGKKKDKEETKSEGEE